MAIAKWLYRLLTVVAVFPIGTTFAQSISISPNSNVSVIVKGTVQFNATVTGLSNTKVNWYAGGVLGGNSSVGKISTKGLYTAPSSVPGTNPVDIKVVSQAQSSLSAATKALVLAVAPKLTSVTPNPLTVGDVTVTLKGSGFLAGATVVDTFNGSAHTFHVTSVTGSTIVATGHQDTADSASFTVANVGSAVSNAVSVPIKKFTLTVKSGTGGGSYAPGKVVSISANSPPQGQVFSKWTGATVANPNSTSTTITMPAANTTVTATYTATNYALTVVNGSGSGTYAAGSTVTITANAPPQGQVFSKWTGATVASATASTTTLTMPAGATTVTATYSASNYALTVVNGTGSGTYAPGATVTITANAPPQGQSFSQWTGATVANATASATTLSMPAAATTVTATYTNPSSVPFPVTTHPRIWLTQNDIPKLQNWATNANPVYVKGMVPLLATVVSNYETQFFPNGQANPTYPDLGDVQGYTGLITEDNAMILAFNSLIDPLPANRVKYAKYAHNLLMYAMNIAAQGPLADAPFRDPAFFIYNRGDGVGHQWPLIVDWIYNAVDESNKPILTSADKQTIRKVFLMWADQCLNASTTGGDHPEPIGTMNDPALLNNGQSAYRMASNNYFIGHARNLSMIALCLDPADDPVIDPAKSPAALGNTMRSYILDATGAWLYQIYAMMGDPQTVLSDYGLNASPSQFGLASGGLPPEGMLYGGSYAALLGQLLALQSSGFIDTKLIGPQAKLATAPVWDRYVPAFISSLTPTPNVNSDATYLGPLYYLAAFGDLLEAWVTPDQMQPFAMLAILEQHMGTSAHVSEARWFTTNAIQGTLENNTSNPWTWGCVQSVLYYLLLDPTASAPADPRPTYPLNFFDPMSGRVLSRTDWTPSATWFDFRSSWESINHQQGDAGEFEFFRNGEWLTKELNNYDDNLLGVTPYYLNSLCLKNWCANGTPNLGWNETGIWSKGGQWMWAGNAGDPVTISSHGTGYTYVATDMTNLYNRPNQWTPGDSATDIQQATRNVVWLNKDYLVIYDRATSLHSNLKSFNLCLANTPQISGNAVQETMASGQKLFVQTLLPQNANLSVRNVINDLTTIAQFETMTNVLTVMDPSNPTDTRFLHVLQGADATATMVPASRVASTSGTAFDGAVVGQNAVFFMTTSGATMKTTTFTVPATVHTFVVTGLPFSTAFGVSTQATTNGTVVTLTVGGATASTDTAGLLKVAI